MASAVMRNPTALASTLRLSLNAALTSRAVIDQAIGIIMARRACTAGEAFAVLRRMSNNQNVKLRDVAAAMTEAVASGKLAERRE